MVSPNTENKQPSTCPLCREKINKIYKATPVPFKDDISEKDRGSTIIELNDISGITREFKTAKSLKEDYDHIKEQETENNTPQMKRMIIKGKLLKYASQLEDEFFTYTYLSNPQLISMAAPPNNDPIASFFIQINKLRLIPDSAEKDIAIANLKTRIDAYKLSKMEEKEKEYTDQQKAESYSIQDLPFSLVTEEKGKSIEEFQEDLDHLEIAVLGYNNSIDELLKKFETVDENILIKLVKHGLANNNEAFYELKRRKYEALPDGEEKNKKITALNEIFFTYRQKILDKFRKKLMAETDFFS
jgi:cyclophilin family peptidyl-prolyl cis-trans isomerase